MVKRSPVVFTPFRTRPSIVTLAMRPCFTSSMNCEYSTAFCVVWRVLNWLNTVMRTSAITSQIATFLIRLFKPSPRARVQGALNGQSILNYSRGDTPLLRPGSRKPLATRYTSLERLREASGLRVCTCTKALAQASDKLIVACALERL